MDTVLGENLILWTVRISVTFYACATWRYLFHVRRSVGTDNIFRRLWLAAWAMCVVHVICAFHFQHHWNHAAAVRHTAEMTARVVGWYWGGGLYINYVFLLMWGVDAMKRFRASDQGLGIIMHATAAFMMFNATVVFGPAWWWIPLILFVVAMAVNFTRKHRQRPDSREFSGKAG